MWGDFFFGYIWMNMDFTVLGRTPEGVQICMLVVLKKRRNRRERKRTMGEETDKRAQRSENWKKT